MISLVKKKIVTVRFDEKGILSSTEYAYFTDLELSNGEWVLVVVGDTPKTAVVCRTTGLPKDVRNKASKWIASKIDLTDYYIRLKKADLINEIEQELDAEMQRYNRYEVFKQCANYNPVIKELLGKLSDIDPTLNLLPTGDR